MNGPRLLGAIALAVAAMCAGLVATADPAAPAVVRWTARTSLVLFGLVYVARPATQLWPRPLTRGLLARRKWLGLGFATSHAFHLAGIIALAWPDPRGFLEERPPNPVGVLSFALLAAMSVTSIDRVRRAMPRRAWRALHLAGLHVAWLIFAVTYARRVTTQPGYGVLLALVLGLAAVRLAAWLRRRGRDAAA